jgi:hypothetical protein
MTPEDEMKLRTNIAQYRAAKLFQTLSILAGLAGTIWYGFASLLAGIGVCWLFHLAKPGPSDELDKLTGRNPR